MTEKSEILKMAENLMRITKEANEIIKKADDLIRRNQESIDKDKKYHCSMCGEEINQSLINHWHYDFCSEKCLEAFECSVKIV